MKYRNKAVGAVVQGLVLIILLALAVSAVAFQLPAVQTSAARKAASALEGSINGRISIDRIAIAFLNRVVAYDIDVVGNGPRGPWADEDTVNFHNPGDTLAHLGKLSVTFSLYDILKGDLRVRRVIVSDASFRLLTEDSLMNTNLSRIFNLPPPDPDGGKGGIPDLSGDDVRVENSSLRISNPFTAPTPVTGDEQMNYRDIDIRDINGRFLDLKTRSGVLTCAIKTLSAAERSGADLREMKGNFYLGPEEAGADDLFLQEGDGTFLRASRLSFHYGDVENLKEWVDSVVMDVNFTGTEFEFHTIRHYVPQMSGCHLRLLIDGHVTGPVSDLDIRDLRVSVPGSRASVAVDAVLKGIPDMPNATIDGTLYDFEATSQGISDVLSLCGGGTGPLSVPAAGQVIRYGASIHGPFRNMHIRGRLSAAGGTISHDARLHLFSSPEVSADGTVALRNFDIARFTGNDIFGPADITLGASFSTSSGNLSVTLDSLNVERFTLKGYGYSGIMAQGKMKNGKADLRAVCHDPAIDAITHLQADLGGADGWKSIALFLQIPDADLHKINLSPGDGASKLSGVWANVDMKMKGPRDIFGEARLSGLTYSNGNGSFTLDSLILTSSYENGQYVLELDSPPVSGGYIGDDPPAEALIRLKETVIRDHFSNLFPARDIAPGILDGPGNDMLSLGIHAPYALTDVLCPGLFISEKTILSAVLRDDGHIRTSLASPRLAVSQNYLKDVDISFDNPDSLLKAEMVCREIQLGGLHFSGNVLSLKSDSGLVRMDYVFRNEDASDRNEMKFSSDFFFSRSAQGRLLTNISIHDSECFLDGRKWTIPASDVTVGGKYFSFNGFRLYNESQEISVQGVISENADDVMKLRLDRFDIGMANLFLKKKLVLGGEFTGDMTVRDLYGEPNLLMDLGGEDVRFYDNEVGRLDIKSKWDADGQRIILILNNKFRDSNPLNISGYFRPSDRSISVNLSLKDFALTYVNPFIEDHLKVTGGTVTGDLSLQGTISDLMLTGEDTRFDSLSFRPVYTGVPCVMNGRMDFTGDGIKFADVEIADPDGHKAYLNGKIAHHFFKDMNMDLSLAFDDFDCVNLTEKESPLFYGRVNAGGEVSLKGPLNSLSVEGMFRTAPGTSVHIPLSNASSATVTDLLSFRGSEVEEDPYEKFIRSKMVRETEINSSLKIGAYASITEDALISAEIDPSLGNVITCRGEGRLTFYMDPANSSIDLRGDYVLSGGDIHYSVAGLLNKNFTLDNGGSISFNGPIDKTVLNLGATYRTKASISTLISDTTSVGMRQNILCGVKLKGSVTDPAISFSIDIPDLEPLTKGRVEAALSSEAKVQQQFMSLLITGGFMPDQQSGIENNNSMLYSNAGELLSSQVNKLFHTLDIPLDLGLNYQRGMRRDLIDVNLSYQAFDNRLVLNGSVGNNQSSRNWGGNFEAELKLDKQGKFRFSLFTKAPDQYANILDNSQRTGFGFTFQNEFDRFVEVFMSRRKREKYELDQMKRAEEELLLEAGQGL